MHNVPVMYLRSHGVFMIIVKFLPSGYTAVVCFSSGLYVIVKIGAQGGGASLVCFVKLCR